MELFCIFANAICVHHSEQEIFSYEINSVLLLFYSRLNLRNFNKGNKRSSQKHTCCQKHVSI